MLCPSVISRFGTLADKQRFDAASAMGQTRPPAISASMSGLPESGLSDPRYSMTSSARASSEGGTVRPSAFGGRQVDDEVELALAHSTSAITRTGLASPPLMASGTAT